MAFCPSLMSFAQRLDPLHQFIFKTLAIDNHCHIFCNPQDNHFTWDPQNPMGQVHYPMSVRLRTDNREWIGAWKALYDYPYDDLKPEHLNKLLQRKQLLLNQLNDSFAVVIMRKSMIATALINHDQLLCKNPAFIWVPYGDSLIQPFGNDSAAHDEGLPKTLSAYINDIVVKKLAFWKSQGAVALKFTIAYWRSLAVEKVDDTQAQQIYDNALRSSMPPSPGNYKKLQDFLIFKICAQAGVDHLVIHFHTGNGEGPFFDNGNSSPALLEQLIDDSSSHHTIFVLIHGGWPFTEITAAMLDKPNVYADFSAQSFYLYPSRLAGNIRLWLELNPEKVLFGTDAYSSSHENGPQFNTPLMDWQEIMWLSSATGREALYLALRGMIADKEISERRAFKIASMVLHENAENLYNLHSPYPK